MPGLNDKKQGFMQVKNFLFHRVSDEVDELWAPMKPALFEKIIHHLTKNYSVVLLEDLLNDPNRFRTITKKIATVQFDDGYKDNIECAAPILQKYECPASFYVVSGCIDTGIPTWTYLLDHALQHTQIKELEIPFDFVPEDKKYFRAGVSNRLADASKPIKPWIKSLSNSHRIKVLDAILEQCKDVAVKKTAMMDWDDVGKLVDQGFHVGSHSHSHPLLASVETEEEIRYELQTSGDRIKQATGKWPVTISYPVGSYDDRVIRLAKECGYKYGLAVEQTFFQVGDNSVMEIPRVELYQEPFWKTYMRISGMINLFKRK